MIHKDTLHELDNYRNLLHAIGIESTAIRPQIRVDVLEKKFGKTLRHEKLGVPNRHIDRAKAIRSIVSSNTTEEINENRKRERLNALISQYKKTVIFHPFPGGTKKEFKMWSDQNWKFLGKNLIQQDYTIWITGAPSDQEHAGKIAGSITKNWKFLGNIDTPTTTIDTNQSMKYSTNLPPKKRQTKKANSGVVVLAGAVDWEEMAWLLLKANILVSVNTGIMHLAAALGIKVIALNGPTSVARWGAIGEKITNFRSTYECSPCLSLGFEYACKAGGCMTRIRAKDVAKSVV